MTVSVINQASKTRVLALSGGGLRGVISAAILQHMEALGRQRYGEDYRLGRAFDLIGGASTGAVIATALALGIDTRRIAEFYLSDAPAVFRRRRFALPGVTSLFDASALGRHYEAATRNRRMIRSELETDLAVVVKDFVAGQPVLLTSLPVQDDTPAQCLGARLVNRPVCLAAALRASTAAPGLFDPADLPIGEDGGPISCVDGGISAFNDPSLLLWTVLTHPSFRHSRGGPIELTKVGTGTVPPPPAVVGRRPGAALFVAIKALRSMINEGERQTEAQMQMIAGTRGSGLVYRTLDLVLEREALRRLGVDPTPDDLIRMRSISEPRAVQLLFRAATCYAEQTIFEAPPPRMPHVARVAEQPIAARAA